MKTRATVVPNVDHEIRKTRTRTQHVQNKNLTRIYYKEETKTN
jgi:hypothetical protein